MKAESYLEFSPEVKSALKNGDPIVALESTILAHGMPRPENKQFAVECEDIVRKEGAVPATTAVIGGKIKVGLSYDELMYMCEAKGVAKISRRDIATTVATGSSGASTVASTMIIASLGGIRFFSTGGIGGVHRGAETSFDISADLQELAGTEVAVVSAGAKSILDLKLTLEYLETFGVPVIGYKTEYFPAFFCESSGMKLDHKAEDAKEIATIIRTKWDLGLGGGVLIANPIPKEFSVDYDQMERVIAEAVKKSEEAGIRGKESTPFILSAIKEATKGESFTQLSEMTKCNAAVGARVAAEYARLK